MTPASTIAPPGPEPATTSDAIEAALGTLGGDRQSLTEQVTLGIFIIVPFLAVFAAIPIAWGGWLGWSDVVIAFVMYAITGHGITVGFHRLFTHKSFKPNRPVKIVLAIAGSMAIRISKSLLPCFSTSIARSPAFSTLAVKWA